MITAVLARPRARPQDSHLFAAAEPLIESFRFVVPFAWIPIAILWFGIHESGKLFIIWYAGFFILLLQTIAGVRGVDPDLVKAARTLGASEAQIFRKVVVPAATPAIFTGLKIGFGGRVDLSAGRRDGGLARRARLSRDGCPRVPSDRHRDRRDGGDRRHWRRL